MLRRLLADGSLTCQERTRLQASRNQFAAYWTVLDRQLRRGKAEEELLPLLRRLASLAGGERASSGPGWPWPSFPSGDCSPCPGRATG